MNSIFPKRLFGYLLLFLPILCLSATSSTFFPEETSPKAPGTYFILAPSGLNLRAASSPGAAKILTIPYGSKIELLTPAAAADMMVDNFPGGMAKVKYGNQEGYVFDGYLSRFPAPEQRQDVKKYVEKIRDHRQGAMYEHCTRDYDGYYQEEEAITLYITDWAEAFLVARQLFEIPQAILFPKPSDKEVETFPNPNKEEEVWEDMITVRRNKKGKLTSIKYFYRREGGGRSVFIEADPQLEAIRLSLTLIAD
jgi:hypothetical protein